MARPLYQPTDQSRIAGLRRDIERLKRRRIIVGRFELKVFADDQIVVTGSNKLIMCVPKDIDAKHLIEVAAFVTTASSTGLVNIQLRNVTRSLTLLSTAITIDPTEFTSYTAAIPAVVNTANDQVFKGDLIAIDVNGAGIGTKGLGVMLTIA